jgi:putative glutamine amidotransferase
VVPLHERQDRVAKLLMRVQGILLPGSGFDVDPQRYGEARIPECGPADAARTAVDELLLQDAFNLKKPILAICHGMQTLNVWCNGTLIQDLQTTVNHRPGRDVVEAHAVRISEGSRLARLLADHRRADVPVNSSHHQAVRAVGDPERTYTLDAFSRAIFSGLVQAASGWVEPRIEESVAAGAGKEPAAGR